MGRESGPDWRGSAVVPAIDETGVAAKFQGQAFAMASYCARKRAGPEDADEVEVNPATERSGEMEVSSSLSSGRKKVGGKAQLNREDGVGAMSTGSQKASTPLSVQALPSPPHSVQVPSTT